MIDKSTIAYALLGGILPALLWLTFWLRQDKKRPEPKGRLAETFLAGMIAVPLVVPFQHIVYSYYPVLGFMPFLIWAIIEELFKFIAVYFTALRSKDDDEPLDPLVYMITGALGFAALENALFIYRPLIEDNIAIALATGGLRFVGASLLHVMASGAVGIFLGIAFFKSRGKKFLYGLVGLIGAISFHTAFNMFILKNQSVSTWHTLGFVWVSIVVLILAFEHLRTIAPLKSRDIM